MLTLWDSLEAIRRFAGANLENAVVEPAAQAALVTYDSTVTHHTVVVYMVGADPRTSELVTRSRAHQGSGSESVALGHHVAVIGQHR